MDKIIEIKSLYKKYTNEYILKNINLDIYKNEIIGLIGPNGAGKSTLIKILCGLIGKSKGEIKILDKNIYPNSLICKKNIGYLSESNPLYTDQYILEFLRFIAKINGIKKPEDDIKSLVFGLGLQNHLQKKISQLSKGYKQRVGIAQAMIKNPKVLILDEPTTGLDPNQISEISKLIIKNSKEKTIIISSHNLTEIERICTRIVMLKDGEIAIDKYQNNNKNVFFIEFENEIDLDYFSTLFDKVEKVSNKLFIVTSIYNLKETHKKITTYINKTNTILNIKPQPKTLEKLFKKVTKKT